MKELASECDLHDGLPDCRHASSASFLVLLLALSSGYCITRGTLEGEKIKVVLIPIIVFVAGVVSVHRVGLPVSLLCPADGDCRQQQVTTGTWAFPAKQQHGHLEAIMHSACPCAICRRRTGLSCTSSPPRTFPQQGTVTSLTK